MQVTINTSSICETSHVIHWRERERGREGRRMYKRERERVCVRVWVRERESVCVCVCACMFQRERERMTEIVWCVGVRASVYVCWYFYVECGEWCVDVIPVQISTSDECTSKYKAKNVVSMCVYDRQTDGLCVCVCVSVRVYLCVCVCVLQHGVSRE